MKLNHTTPLIIYLAALVAFAPFSTDIYLASMPMLQKQLATSPAMIQITLSGFFICFAVMQLLWGPLSDRIGRKPVILIGVSIYIIGSLLCALSMTINELITARIIQAFGACAGIVMAIAIVKDHFTNPKEMSKVLSGMMSVAIVAPMIAPVIGSYLLVKFNWQANFYFLTLYGFILLLGGLMITESHPTNKRQPLPVNRLLHAYTVQISHWPFLLAVVAVSTNFCVLFSFIASSSFIYIDIYHLPAHLFGYFFAFNAAALIIGTLTLPRLKSRIKDDQLLVFAIGISMTGTIIMIIALLFQPNVIWSVALPSFIVTFGVGLLYPELTHYALNHVVKYTGLTSSLIGTSRFLLAAIIGFIMGLVISNSALPLALAMLLLNLVTAIAMWFYIKSSKQQHAALNTL